MAKGAKMGYSTYDKLEITVSNSKLEARKAKSVKASLEGPITPFCPASILRTQEHAQLFLDQESSSELNRDPS